MNNYKALCSDLYKTIIKTLSRLPPLATGHHTTVRGQTSGNRKRSWGFGLPLKPALIWSEPFTTAHSSAGSVFLWSPVFTSLACFSSYLLGRKFHFPAVWSWAMVLTLSEPQLPVVLGGSVLWWGPGRGRSWRNSGNRAERRWALVATPLQADRLGWKPTPPLSRPQVTYIT